MIDDDDRHALGTIIVRTVAVILGVLIGAVTAGLALRLFQIVSGI